MLLVLLGNWKISVANVAHMRWCGRGCLSPGLFGGTCMCVSGLRSAILQVGTGIGNDVLNRLRWYRDDWTAAGRCKFRVLAAATYIFLASVLPALAFGQQLASETDGVLTVVHVLAATAIGGTLQAVIGGQPLLIVGVAEPIVLVYKYMYDFARGQKDLGADLFLAWSAWTCVWASLMVMILAVSGAASYISRFTRFAGESFGALIAVLFMQQAIKGTILEYSYPNSVGQPWQLVNGTWSLFLAWGLLLSGLLLRTARRWRFLNWHLRAFLADYGVPIAILFWTGVSYAIQGPATATVPSRVTTPLTWQVHTSWHVASRMSLVGGKYIAAALVPALIIAILFFFDHNVSSQLAQAEEFRLVKPSAYHWDMLLVGVTTLMCGLLGLPPVNGVIPQSPMHTKALSVVVQAPRVQPTQASQSNVERVKDELSHHQTYENGIEYTDEASGSDSRSVHTEVVHGQDSIRHADSRTHLAMDIEMVRDQNPGSARRPLDIVPHDTVELDVCEQRWSPLLQSIAVGACLGAIPAIRFLPTAVLWGYFAFMAVESLPGSQLWDRTLLLLTDPSKRAVLLEMGHAPYLETVPFKTIVTFTALQLLLVGGVYGLTWAGIAGVLFPIPIMLMVPFRQFILPLIYSKASLQALDAINEEEAEPLPHERAIEVATAAGMLTQISPIPEQERMDSGELLESEIRHFRVVHHLSETELQQRRRSMSREL